MTIERHTTLDLQPYQEPKPPGPPQSKPESEPQTQSSLSLRSADLSPSSLSPRIPVPSPASLEPHRSGPQPPPPPEPKTSLPAGSLGSGPASHRGGSASNSAPRGGVPRTPPVNLSSGPASHSAVGTSSGLAPPLQPQRLLRWQFRLLPFLAPPPLGVLPLHGPPLGPSTELPDAHERTTDTLFPCFLFSSPRDNVSLPVQEDLMGTGIIPFPKGRSWVSRIGAYNRCLGAEPGLAEGGPCERRAV